MRVPVGLSESSRSLKSHCLVPLSWFTLSEEPSVKSTQLDFTNNSTRNYPWHFCRKRMHLPDSHHKLIIIIIITTTYFYNFEEKYLKGINKLRETPSSRALLSWDSNHGFGLHQLVPEITSVPCALTVMQGSMTFRKTLVGVKALVQGMVCHLYIKSVKVMALTKQGLRLIQTVILTSTTNHSSTSISYFRSYIFSFLSTRHQLILAIMIKLT